VGGLKVGSDDFVLKLNSGDGPSIWAQSTTNGNVVFLALGPDLPSAYTWYKKSNSTSMSPKGWTYLLTLMRPSDPTLYVTRMYNDQPPLDVLKSDIAATIRQELPTIVVYDRSEGRASVRLPSNAKNADQLLR
jgi:hypothetical protein